MALAPFAWRIFISGLRTESVREHLIEYRRWRAERGSDFRMAIYEGSFFLVKAAMVIARANEDVAVMDFHFAPIHDGLVIDGPADDDMLDAIKARLLTFWDDLHGYFPAEDRLDRIVFHNAGPTFTDAEGFTLIGDGTRKKDHPGTEPANPALRTDLLSGLVGSSTTTKWMPPQTAVTITFKTTKRRSWGRVYVPFSDSNWLRTEIGSTLGRGQLHEGACGDIADYAESLVNGCSADDVPMVVWSHVHQNARSIDTVQVDSLFDVIRSRRFDRAVQFEDRIIGP